MSETVVDASAIAAVIFGEDGADGIVDRIRSADLVAPVLIDYELANVCLNKKRRNPGRIDAILEGWRSREALRIERRTVDIDRVLATARATGLTAYDAAYLVLALESGADLVTLDRALAEAVERARG